MKNKFFVPLLSRKHTFLNRSNKSFQRLIIFKNKIYFVLINIFNKLNVLLWLLVIYDVRNSQALLKYLTMKKTWAISFKNIYSLAWVFNLIFKCTHIRAHTLIVRAYYTSWFYIHTYVFWIRIKANWNLNSNHIPQINKLWCQQMF